MSHRVISLATTAFVAAAVLLAPTPVATAVVETCPGRTATNGGTRNEPRSRSSTSSCRSPGAHLGTGGLAP